MAPLNTPPHQTPRSIGPAYHEQVWQLYQDGLSAPQIAAALAASGCRATRHSVRRLLQQLRWAQARETRAQAFIQDTKKDRVTAFTARHIHQEALSDLCDDLVIAARKEEHERVLSLSRAGRILLRTVEQYERVYEAGLKREIEVLLAEPPPPRPVPEGVPTIDSPREGQESRHYEVYPRGSGAPRSEVEVLCDGQPLTTETCNSAGHWLIMTPGRLQPGPHTLEAGYKGSPLRSAAVHFTILGLLLLIGLSTTSCLGIVRHPVKTPLTPARGRASGFSGETERLTAGQVQERIAARARAHVTGGGRPERSAGQMPDRFRPSRHIHGVTTPSFPSGATPGRGLNEGPREIALRRSMRGDLRLFALGATREAGERIARKLSEPLSPVEERDFEDGEHKTRALVNVRECDVFVIQSLYGDTEQSANDKLCRLLFFLGSLVDASAAHVTAVVPYLAYARKDRKTKPRDPVTTRYVARLIESTGADRVVTLDVHNLAAFQNAFRCHTDHLEAQELFVRHFAPLARERSVAVVSPDVGGVKRAEAFRQSLEAATGKRASLAMLDKRRSEGVVTGEAFVGNVEGKIALIIDDMVSSGTTLLRAARACRDRGASQVFAAASHGVFVGDANRVLADPAIDGVVVTDSIPPFRLATTARRRVTVLDSAPLFAEAIRRIHEGGSIVDLLEGGRDARE